MDSLVSTVWLAQHLDDPDLVIVDSSWHMPKSGRSGNDEFVQAHIPGARFLDIDDLSDRSNPAPHMLPAAAEAGRAFERLGIGRDDRIVVYDNSPIHTAARGWFTLRYFGAGQVAILDGGLPQWLAEGRPTESGEPSIRTARFDAVERAEIVTKQQLLAGASRFGSTPAAGRASRDRSPIPGPGLPPAMRREPATCRSACSTKTTAASGRSTRSSGCSPTPASIPRGRSSPVAGPVSPPPA